MDESIVKDIAAALWQIESQLQSLNAALEKVIGSDEAVSGKQIHFIRTIRSDEVLKK